MICAIKLINHTKLLMVIITLKHITSNERISSVTRWATTHWNVVDDFTYCIVATSLWTGSYTFFPYTNLISWTICTYSAFRSTSYVRVAVIFW